MIPSLSHVTIQGVDKAIDAATWCKDHITSKWEMNLGATIFADGSYEFLFSDPHEATVFALRWR